jgi:predicted phosphodiesterase
MKLQIASDLHLEFYDDKVRGSKFFETLLTPSAPVLILAGDICPPERAILKTFFEWCSEKWSMVFWIFGNHEYYSKMSKRIPMDEKIKMAERVCASTKVIFLQEASIDIGTYRFLGATLWTDLGFQSEGDMYEVRKTMSDFSKIVISTTTDFTVKEWLEEYGRHRKFIEENLQACEEEGRKAIVITHHMPTFRMIQEKYKDFPGNAGFAANADSLLEHPSVALWICGHSHGQKVLEVEKRNREIVSCVLNARGYPREDSVSTYNSAFVVEL